MTNASLSPLSLSAEIAVDLHRLVKEELSRAHYRLSELSMETSGLEKRIVRLSALEEATKSVTCRACGGFGRVNIVYDQDDIKSETCEVCKGSGVKAG